ncbi:hypothetical protein [Mycolicibacter arupensis]|jgi:hypothetical protein|uniref:Uncharacterized protein n=1 Tax=Mycolicibacter arupensis TaxID=342002 RepID=A0A0F5MUD2_9MYCO|nr:hypothetical protein [Mycolicibacter arupensis]KKB98296.1 hypothetical protein WR43_15255 [Mycolicibacter arupensis]MCV7275730.1 hypothetical protein [Mycolicibacter arupensis]OQZ94388.1 hypothetical protein BST15_16605 [Mycolicibacter arupensis]TXI50250.1 MAG: hypothetical protein E6Q54_21615 [Mycolicibacter arupensis]
MSAGIVSTLRLTDTDRRELLNILLLARHDGDPDAGRLVDLVDAAYSAALAADRTFSAANDFVPEVAEALDGCAL